MDNRFGPFDCPVCCGAECRGGGNLRCAQRDPQHSFIAGILDSYGGMRVVVAHRNQYKHHVRHDEFLCIYPGKRVHTPIAWGDVPMVVHIGETAVENWVKQHERDNDPQVLDAIRAYKSRKSWLTQRSLHLPDICYT